MLGCGVETSSVYQAGWDVLISLGDVLGWRLKAAVPRCGEGDREQVRAGRWAWSDICAWSLSLCVTLDRVLCREALVHL